MLNYMSVQGVQKNLEALRKKRYLRPAYFGAYRSYVLMDKGKEIVVREMPDAQILLADKVHENDPRETGAIRKRVEQEVKAEYEKKYKNDRPRNTKPTS